MLPTNSTIPKFLKKISFPTCSQIWLSPLLDDSQPTYLTILRKKNQWQQPNCIIGYGAPKRNLALNGNMFLEPV
jgi:hypothetical protein